MRLSTLDDLRQIQLSTDDMVYVNGRYYFAERFGNGCYSIDFSQDEVLRLEFTFPYPVTSERLFVQTMCWQDELIFAPFTAPDIVLYNLRTKTLRTIPVPKRELPRKTWCKDTLLFWSAFVAEEAVYFLGHGFPGILRLSLLDENIEVLDDWIPDLLHMRRVTDDPYLSGFTQRGDTVYITVACADALLELNVKTNETNLVRLKTGLAGFNGIADDGEYFWITPRHFEDLLLYHPENGFKKRISLRKVLHGKKKIPPFYAPLIRKKDVLLAPIFADGFLSVDRESKRVRLFQPEALQQGGKLRIQTSGMDMVECPTVLNDGRYLFQDGRTGLWYCGEGTHWRTVNMFADERTVMSHTVACWNQVVTEGKEHSLEDLTELLSVWDGHVEQQRCPEQSAGASIWQSVTS